MPNLGYEVTVIDEHAPADLKTSLEMSSATSGYLVPATEPAIESEANLAPLPDPVFEAIVHERPADKARSNWQWVRPSLLGLFALALGFAISYIGFGFPPYQWQQQQVTMANATINRQNGEIATDRQEIGSLRSSLNEETQKNADLQRQVSDLQGQVTGLTNQLNTAREQLQSAQAQAGAAQMQAAAAQSAAQQAAAAAAAQAAKCHSLLIVKVCT